MWGLVSLVKKCGKKNLILKEYIPLCWFSGAYNQLLEEENLPARIGVIAGGATLGLLLGALRLHSLTVLRGIVLRLQRKGSTPYNVEHL